MSLNDNRMSRAPIRLDAVGPYSILSTVQTLMRESRVFDATRKGHKAAINVPKAASTINASTKKVRGESEILY